MLSFLGEYDCKVDSKGRLKMPSGLKRQLHPDDQDKFVLSRGIEEHLNLYPLKEWNIVRKRGQISPLLTDDSLSPINVYIDAIKESITQIINNPFAHP